MRILDLNRSASLDNVILCLKKDEAIELLGLLEDLLKRPFNEAIRTHHHVNDAEYQHEITVTMYDEQDLSIFDERSKRLIVEDK